MTDFVTRLEGELHAAALRHEGAGAVRRVALPRMRSGLRALPAAAAAAALLAVAGVGIGIVLSSSPERTAHRRAAGAARHLRAGADGAEVLHRGLGSAA